MTHFNDFSRQIRSPKSEIRNDGDRAGLAALGFRASQLLRGVAAHVAIARRPSREHPRQPLSQSVEELLLEHLRRGVGIDGHAAPLLLLRIAEGDLARPKCEV